MGALAQSDGQTRQSRGLIEIVTHCYCPPGVDHYAQCLKWQFASLERHPPQSCDVQLSVCCTPLDHATADELRALLRRVDRTPGFRLRVELLPPEQLFRRAIGRNRCAKQSRADIVWYTDADYLFGEGCLDQLWQLADHTTKLVMPSQILIQTDHQTGDRMLADGRHDPCPEIDRSLFKPRRQKICIGGCQIVGGDFARKYGYLDGTPWVEPVDPRQGFRSCRCDKAFRSTYQLSAIRLPLPEVYRIRHSVDGRDYDQHGTRVGRDAW